MKPSAPTADHSDVQVLMGQVEALTLLVTALLKETRGGTVPGQAATDSLSRVCDELERMSGPPECRSAALLLLRDIADDLGRVEPEWWPDRHCSTTRQ